MKKTLLVVLTLVLVFPKAVFSQSVGGHSAILSSAKTLKKTSPLNPNKDYFLKRKVIRRVLEKYNSPMADAADSFVDTCIKYDLDCYLLPSIAGVESYFGTHLVAGSYNPFGWGRGLVMFEDWDHGINTVGNGLRENYINKGLITTEQIGRKYCEGNTWAGKVVHIKGWFLAEEENVRLFFENDTVKL